MNKTLQGMLVGLVVGITVTTGIADSKFRKIDALNQQTIANYKSTVADYEKTVANYEKAHQVCIETIDGYDKSLMVMMAGELDRLSATTLIMGARQAPAPEPAFLPRWLAQLAPPPDRNGGQRFVLWVPMKVRPVASTPGLVYYHLNRNQKPPVAGPFAVPTGDVAALR